MFIRTQCSKTTQRFTSTTTKKRLPHYFSVKMILPEGQICSIFMEEVKWGTKKHLLFVITALAQSIFHGCFFPIPFLYGSALDTGQL